MYRYSLSAITNDTSSNIKKWETTNQLNLIKYLLYYQQRPNSLMCCKTVMCELQVSFRLSVDGKVHKYQLFKKVSFRHFHQKTKSRLLFQIDLPPASSLNFMDSVLMYLISISQTALVTEMTVDTPPKCCQASSLEVTVLL